MVFSATSTTWWKRIGNSSSTHSSTVRIKLLVSPPSPFPPLLDNHCVSDAAFSQRFLPHFSPRLSLSYPGIQLTICQGLSRLEYRGYDSAGLAIDGDKKNEVLAFKEVGKVAKLKALIEETKPDLTNVFDSHCGIAHTRWATHGPPSRLNCHPHRYV